MLAADDGLGDFLAEDDAIDLNDMAAGSQDALHFNQKLGGDDYF